MTITKFEDLQVWQKSMSLTKKLFTKFVHSRSNDLKSQILKSAVSIPSNIAEGFDRKSNKEYIRFLSIARASCAELRTQLLIANDVEVGLALENDIEETKIISAMISKLIQVREKYFS